MQVMPVHSALPRPAPPTPGTWILFAPQCSQVCWNRWTLQCVRTKLVRPKASASPSESCPSRNHNRPLVMVLIMNARRFQRTHPLSGTGPSLNASKDVEMGITDLMPISDPVVDAGYTAVVGAVCPCVFEAGSDCKDGSSDVSYVGDTRWSFSEK